MKKSQKGNTALVNRSLYRNLSRGTDWLLVALAASNVAIAVYIPTEAADILRSQVTVNQIPKQESPGAKAAADRYEALEHGYWKPGTDPMTVIMYGYIPPGMSQQEALMLYKALPHMPKMPEPMTSERVARMAGEPADPLLNLPQGFDPGNIAAANQKIFEESVRECLGPIYIPPLHRDHNRSAQSASPLPGQKGPAVNSTLVQRSYSKDHLGSIREMTNTAGAIEAQYYYDPYGRLLKTQGSLNADFEYCGYYYHIPSAVSLTPNRAYSSYLGRWLSRDPIGEAGGINLYAYVHNDPIDYSDPSGLWQYSLSPGNWGGPNWTNGRDQSELTNFSYKPGMPGFRQPTNPRDRCYYWHDICLHNAARNNNSFGRQCNRRFCDNDLAKCLQYVSDTYGATQFGIISPGEIGYFGREEKSPNDSPGKYVPNLLPYPPNFNPGVQNAGKALR